SGAAGRLDLADHEFDPRVGSLARPQPGAADLDLADPGDRGAENPREGAVGATDVETRDPAGLVGDGAQGDVHRPTGHEVVHLGAVTRGPDALGRGLLAMIDRHRTPVTDLDAGFLGQFTVGRHAEADDRQVGLQVAGIGVHDAVTETG